MAQHVVKSSSYPKQVKQNLSVKLRDTPSPNSKTNSKASPNAKSNASPVSALDVDFNYPDSPFTPVTPNVKSRFARTKDTFEEETKNRELKSDIPNSEVQTKAEYDNLRNKEINPRPKRAKPDEDSKGRTWVDRIGRFHPIFKHLFANHKSEEVERRDYNPFRTSSKARGVSKLGKNYIYPFCSICNGKIKENRELFVYMDKGFCSRDCRKISIEQGLKYDTFDDHMYDLIPAKFYNHKGPTFIPIDED